MIQLFPHLKEGIFGYINQNEESLLEQAVNFTDPAEFGRWIRMLHRDKGFDYSYGGFLEDRSNLWKAHYMKDSHSFMHLGVDYYVPEGTEVALPLDGTIAHVMADKDQNGGWGGRVLMQLKHNRELFALFGHLAHNLYVSAGDSCNEAKIIGKVAGHKDNGGWYPHLHLQIMDSSFVKKYQDNLDSIDGYLPRHNPDIHLMRDPAEFFEHP
jgi:murein DD-endopeptidase MepM/ murein hydrolase activator NlpD